MIKTSMVRTMTIAVPLALVGTFLIPTFVMAQIDESNTIYTYNSVSFSIAENLGYEVNYAPTLTLVPEFAQQQGYEFVDGVKGIGAFGFQIPIATVLPWS